MYRFAIVEDSKVVNDQYSDWLAKAYPGAEIDQFFTFEAAKAAITKDRYDLALLDVHLPDHDQGGIALAADLKALNTPMLIASGAAQDVALGVMRKVSRALGVWDYIEKPVKETDLLNQVCHVLQVKELQSRSTTDSDLFLDPRVNGNSKWKRQELGLTATEVLIVERLTQGIGSIVSGDELTDILKSGARGSLNTHIANIREKFKSVDEHFDRIKTVPGDGYLWRPSK